MSDSPSLREASVQDIQLELIRRRRFNNYYGEAVYASLLKHRSLWTAVLLDRPGVPNYAEQTHLLMGALIKLRDLPQNYWNADTLFILTPSRSEAHELARIAEEEAWGGEIMLHEDLEETDRALGTGRQKYGLLSMWWD
jgi:hypothetical protein